MTPDERALLIRFLDDLVATRVNQRDPEAADLIGRAMASNPDAAYALVQHTIVADQSLHAAQDRIADLEAQLRAARPAEPAGSGGFLSSGTSPWAQRGTWRDPAPQPAPGYGAAPAYGYAPEPPAQRPGIFSAQTGLGSFLRSAGTTAAGVAGGELLFSGIRDMFGGGHSGEREVVNNFYGDDGRDDGSNDDSSWDDNDN